MLLTISTTHQPASDLGYLLHKHPDHFQSFDLSFGKAHVLYPEVSADRSTASLLLEVDPVGMVRGKGQQQSFVLGHYVKRSTRFVMDTPNSSTTTWRQFVAIYRSDNKKAIERSCHLSLSDRRRWSPTSCKSKFPRISALMKSIRAAMGFAESTNSLVDIY